MNFVKKNGKYVLLGGVLLSTAFFNQDVVSANSDSEIVMFDSNASNTQERIGMITEEAVGFRKEPAVSSDSLIKRLNKGEIVKIVGISSVDSNWYEVNYNGQRGFIHKDYLKTYTVNIEKDFEKYLDSQGFDESYKVKLRELHALHPQWTFYGDKTNLDWNQVIEKANGYSYSGSTYTKKNIIPKNSPAEYKTDRIPNETNYGSYWAPASKKAIEHYMDPTNFLDEASIFQFISNRYDPATHNKEGVEAIVKGTFMDASFPESGYARYSDVIMEAARQSNVSPYTIASMIRMEQGAKGTSGSISGTVSGYEGIYNYFNIGAYDGQNAIRSGLAYAKKKGWNSRAKSIIGSSIWFGQNYVNKGQYTPYLKKFNVMNGVNKVGTHEYMTNVAGAYGEGKGEYKAYKELFDLPLSFYIPIYNGMNKTEASFELNHGNKAIKKNEDWGFLGLTQDKSLGTPTIISSNPDVVAVKHIDTGDNRGFYFEAKGLKTGKSTITVNYGKFSKSLVITVVGDDLFYINHGNKEVKQNEDWGFLGITQDKSLGTPSIKSSNPDVVAVKHIDTGDNRGFYFEAKGLKVGKSTVTVTYAGISKSIEVTVKSDENLFYINHGNKELKQNEDWGFLGITKDKSLGTPSIKSSNPDVVAVKHIDTGDNRGFYFEAKGLKTGNSTVTVTYGGIRKSIDITVKGVDENLFYINHGNKELKQNEDWGFLGITKDKSLGTPSIKSSNPDVVAVKHIDTGDNRGFYFEAKGLKTGKSTVTVTYGGVSKSIDVTVKINDNLYYLNGEDNKLVSEGEDWGFLGITKDKSLGTPSIKSSNPDVVAVKYIDTGDSRGFYFEVKGLKTGVATVTVNYGGIKKTKTINVKEKDLIKLNIGNSEVNLGERRGFLGLTDDKKLGTPIITSSNNDIVKASYIEVGDNRGFYFEVLGLREGSATVTVKYAGQTKSINIKVLPPKDNLITLSKNNKKIEIGESWGFLGITDDKTLGVPTITSDNPSVVVGKHIMTNDSRGFYFEIKGLKKGHARVTVDYLGVKKYVDVDVVNQIFYLNIGSQETEKFERRGFLAITNNKNLGTPTITSSRPDVVEVKHINTGDSRGFYFEYRGLKVGESKITVSYGGVEKEFTVKITETSNSALRTADIMLDRIGRDLYSAYQYAAFLPYQSMTTNWGLGAKYFANYGFQNGKGNCYVKSSIFYYMAKALGYNVRLVEGTVKSASVNGVHGWCEIVEADGVVHVYDLTFEQVYKTTGYDIRYGQKGKFNYNRGGLIPE